MSSHANILFSFSPNRGVCVLPTYAAAAAAAGQKQWDGCGSVVSTAAVNVMTAMCLAEVTANPVGSS